MNWFTAIMVYVIIWWTVLFVVLPWGNSPWKIPRPATPPARRQSRAS